MSRGTRERPARLPEKLKHIRTALGLSQNQMLDGLELRGKGYRHYISGYETGRREPSLVVLLRYATLANVIVNALIDDRINLPNVLPAKRSYKWSLSRMEQND